MNLLPCKNQRSDMMSDPMHRVVGPFLYSPIKNDSDIFAARDRMSAKYYPVDMADCEVVGINGDCGESCPVLLRGACPCAAGMRLNLSDQRDGGVKP